MDHGRLSGKLHSHEDWLGMSGVGRELLVTVWSWAIDHDKDDGLVSEAVLRALSGSLGHDVNDRPNAASDAIEALATWGWIEPVAESVRGNYTGEYRLLRWDEEAAAIRKAIARREKERARYLRRKGSGG